MGSAGQISGGEEISTTLPLKNCSAHVLIKRTSLAFWFWSGIPFGASMRRNLKGTHPYFCFQFAMFTLVQLPDIAVLK